jgi:hypothetical protein
MDLGHRIEYILLSVRNKSKLRIRGKLNDTVVYLTYDG